MAQLDAWGAQMYPASVLKLQIAAVLLLVALTTQPPSLDADSDVWRSCSDCTVGASRRDELARWFATRDLVFEGTLLRRDTVKVGYEKGRPLGVFRIERLLRGVPASSTVTLMLPIATWRPDQDLNGRLLVWSKLGCSIDAFACCAILRIAPDRTMTYTSVPTDWRPESAPLICDSLERDIVSDSDGGELRTIQEVQSLVLVRLNTTNPTQPGAPQREFCPDSGGTWPVAQVLALLPTPPSTLRFVHFHRQGPYGIGFMQPGDQLLVPITSGTSDTYFAPKQWRPLVVRDSLLIWFGIPVDSLLSRYTREGDVYRLSPFPER